MRDIKQFMKSNLHKAYFVLLGMVAFFPIFDSDGISKLVGVFLGASFLLWMLFSRKLNKNFGHIWLINVAFYLLLLLSVLYSSNFSKGIDNAVKAIGILLFPLVMWGLMPQLDTKKKDRILLLFSYLNFVLILYFCWVFYDYFELSSMRNIRRAFKNLDFRFAIKYGLNDYFHTTYLSASILLSLCILLRHWFQMSKRGLRKTIFIVIMMVSFAAFILLLRVRIVFLAFFFIVPLQLIFSIRHQKYRKMVGFGVLSIFMLLFVGSFANERIRNYILTPLIQMIKPEPATNGKALHKEFRIEINVCNFEVIKANWLIGAGWGDANEALIECFKEKELFKLSRGRYNSHNQYAYLWMSSGVFCLLFFIIMMGYNAWRAIQSGNILYLAFMLLVLSLMLTENILYRIYGVTFYAFFNALLHSFTIQTLNRKGEK